MPGTITILVVEDDDDHANLLAFALTQVKARCYDLQRLQLLFLAQARPVRPDSHTAGDEVVATVGRRCLSPADARMYAYKAGRKRARRTG